MAMMIFEFQREGSDGDWEALGISRTSDDAFDIDQAVEALTASETTLTPGSYRVRALEAEQRWHFAQVDEHGAFQLVDHRREDPGGGVFGDLHSGND